VSLAGFRVFGFVDASYSSSTTTSTTTTSSSSFSSSSSSVADATGVV
jgi:hypothetical protein